MEQKLRTVLEGVSTAALTSALLKKGLRNIWLRGANPVVSGQRRIVGPAFTLRFIPVREDFVGGVPTPATTTRTAIEAMPEGVVVVADALARTDAGIVGDVLTARMAKRGVAGLVTDGSIRDRVGVLASSLPIWCAGVSAPPPQVSLSFVGWQEPISCGGVAIIPNDIIVADDDGAIVIPSALASEIAADADEIEKADAWVIDEVERGVPLPGLYPMNSETRARYELHRSRS